MTVIPSDPRRDTAARGVADQLHSTAGDADRAASPICDAASGGSAASKEDSRDPHMRTPSPGTPGEGRGGQE